MANVFKLHKYQTFGLLKMHNMSKIWFANNKSVCEKVWLKINGLSKMLFFNFCLFIFPNFKWLLSKSLWKNHSISMDFEHSYEVLLRHKCFDLHIFDNETMPLLNFLKIFMEMHFISLFFPNESNIATSLLMIHLKCTVVHYAIMQVAHYANSANKPYLWVVEYAILLGFFSISYLCLF